LITELAPLLDEEDEVMGKRTVVPTNSQWPTSNGPVFMPLTTAVTYSVTRHYMICNRTSISCRWRTRATRCITSNVLQTKVDAQFDKLATELSWQRLRRSTFSSYSELFVESRPILTYPHLHLAP